VDNNVKVSVIIPVYNAEKYIRKNIESIRKQTLKDIEIICVDDGSIDKSVIEIQKQMKEDARIILLQQENGGGGKARNLGLTKVTGKYCVFLDADDFFAASLLEKMYDRLEETQADLAVCNVQKYHDTLQITLPEASGLRKGNLPIGKKVFTWKDMPEYIFNTFQNWPWNKLFRTDVIREHNIKFQELMRTNDLLFVCKFLIYAKGITCIDEKLVNYRIGMSVNCQATNSNHPFDFYYAFKALKKFLNEIGIYEKVKRSFVNHAISGCVYNLNSQEGDDKQNILYTKLKEEIFDELDIRGKDKKYFLKQSQNIYKAMLVIEDNDMEGYLRYRLGQVKGEKDNIEKNLQRDKKELEEIRKKKGVVVKIEGFCKKVLCRIKRVIK